MQDVLQQLLTLLRGIWHRRWIGLAVAWLTAIIGIAVVYRIPERYEASARVYVDTQSLLRPLMAGLAIQPNLDQQVSLMSRTLISRPNVEKLVHMADLDLRITSSADREEMIDNLMKQLQLTGITPVDLADTRSSIAVPETDARITAVKTKLDELLRNYTDEHPDVVGSRRVIKELEQQRAKEIEALQKAAASAKPGESNTEANPVYQQIKDSLADAEANVASLRAKVDSYERQFAQLKASARLVPQAEAEYAQLNRDYDVQKKTYETLLARREAATMGVGVQDTGGTQFRIIDPPRVAADPVPPTRVALLTIACAISLLAGLAASFIANEVLPTFRDTRALREVAGRPILGTV